MCPWDPLTSKEDSGMKGQHIWSISLLLSSQRVKHVQAHAHSLTGAQQHKRSSSTYQSCTTCCPTCYMRTQWKPTGQRTALPCNYSAIALTASADSRQLQIETSLRCQVCMHLHTNMFGILLHNHPHISLSLAFMPTHYTWESFKGRDSARGNETSELGLITWSQAPNNGT